MNSDPESIKQAPLTNEDLYRRQMAMLKSFLVHGAICQNSIAPAQMA